MAKNGHVHVAGKVGRSDATPTKFFSVDFFDLKSLSYKFGNYTLITFEMGILQKARWQNEHFDAIPSICNQRSLAQAILPNNELTIAEIICLTDGIPDSEFCRQKRSKSSDRKSRLNHLMILIMTANFPVFQKLDAYNYVHANYLILYANQVHLQ